MTLASGPELPGSDIWFHHVRDRGAKEPPSTSRSDRHRRFRHRDRDHESSREAQLDGRLELIGELHDIVDQLDHDPSVRVVVLTGSGRAFCAGLDIKGGEDPGDPGEPIESGMIPASLQIQEFIASLHEHIHRSRKPFIAAVNGVAVGGGFSLALACDVRIASSAASFGAVFIRLGISACDMGTSYFLPGSLGPPARLNSC